LIKAAPVISTPRLLNTFFPLLKAIPDEESMDYEVVRKETAKLSKDDLMKRGADYMRTLFGESDGNAFIDRVSKYWPDLRKSVFSHCSAFR
jgi:hypothetical protein